MGIQLTSIAFLNESVKESFIDYLHADMCDLGNQWLRASVGLTEQPAVNLWRLFVKSYVSIDINGKDGSENIDMSVPIYKPELLDRFDILTNFGFTEHVRSQYAVFFNIHQFTRVGGLMVHESPGPNGNDWEHCPYRYNAAFYRHLAQAAGYECLSSEDGRHEWRNSDRVRAAFLKKDNSVFPDEETFATLGLIDIRVKKA